MYVHISFANPLYSELCLYVHISFANPLYSELCLHVYIQFANPLYSVKNETCQPVFFSRFFFLFKMTVFRKQYFIHRPLIDKRRFQHYNCSMPEEKHISSNKHDFIEHNLHGRFYVRQYIGCGMRQGLVSLCFEPSQPLRVTSGLNEVGGGRGGGGWCIRSMARDFSPAKPLLSVGKAF